MSTMIVVYTGETPPESFTSSMFLAGPSPRKPADPNWRTEAVKLLEGLDYDGVVFAPVWRDTDAPGVFDYDKQVEWERKWLNASDLVVFWVPRDLKSLPGFTTNVEFGMWLRSGKAILGFPKDAEKMDYLEWWAKREGVPVFNDLGKTLDFAVDLLHGGGSRTGGERDVPYHLWLKPEFQTWLAAQKAVGNRLDGAEVVWTFRVGKHKERTFLWALHVDVWVESEGRSKTNEVVVFRPDISTIVAYCRPPMSTENDWLLDTEVVLVREFRSPANNYLGMVREVPGGSSMKEGVEADLVASTELEEETGISIQRYRFQLVDMRQIASTLCAHRAHLFAVELTSEEMLSLKWTLNDPPKGNREDTEITYTAVSTVRDMMSENSVDWSNLGMVFQALVGRPSP